MKNLFRAFLIVIALITKVWFCYVINEAEETNDKVVANETHSEKELVEDLNHYDIKIIN